MGKGRVFLTEGPANANGLRGPTRFGDSKGPVWLKQNELSEESKSFLRILSFTDYENIP